MSKRPFKSQASSSRLDPASSFGGFGSIFAGSTLSYVSEPPSLSSITDANVVVAFKNLTKKDSTTKSKGLEDLRSNIQSHPYEKDGGVEQPILEAWVKLYPRISIDNSRRVRELSHHLQYELLKSARKRMEKYIPTIVGPWLAGMYDRDRTVSRAAMDGVNSFLDSEDKVIIFWRRCQLQILAYAQEAIKETPQTLSDERNVSVDDAQAKYDRVIGSSLSLVINLLVKLDKADILKQQESYEEFFSSNKTLWGFITSQDSPLRKTSAQLLSVCLDKFSEIIERSLETVSHAFLAEGLRSSQNGSAFVFLQALNKATAKFPKIWLSAYKGKKSASSRLRLFVAKGSQGGPPQFWQSLSFLILNLPTGVLQTDLNGAVDFLKAYREGISSREEPRKNTSAAWNSYLDVARHFGSCLADPVTFERFLSFAIFPAFEEFLHPVPDLVSWSMENSIAILPQLFHLCYLPNSSKLPQSLQDEWIRLAESLINMTRLSLPEQSKDYARSQDAVTAEANRWFELQASILTSANAPYSKLSEDSIIDFLKDSFSKVIVGAIEVLRNRNGKPDGAAGTLEAALRLTPKLFHAIPSVQDLTTSFLKSELPRLVLSPSSQNIIGALYAFQNMPNRDPQFKAMWQAAIDGLLGAPEDSQKMKALKWLIANHSTSQLARQDHVLQGHLLERISKIVKGYDEDWPMLELSLKFDVLDAETSNSIISAIVDSLRDQAGSLDAALRALELIVQGKPQMLQSGESTHTTIIACLLALTESPVRSIVSRANILKGQIEGAGEILATQSLNSSPTLDIIRENLENAGPRSLAIDTLVRLAEDFLDVGHESENHKAFPNAQIWFQALQPLLDCCPDSSLSLTSSVGPGVSLVRPMSDLPALKLSRDTHGYSIPFRMALYTSKLLSRETRLLGLSIIEQVEILRLLSFTVLLASDQLGLGEQNKLWAAGLGLDVESQIVDFLRDTELSMAQQFKTATSWRSGDTEGSSAVAERLMADLLAASSGDLPLAFYSARALSSLLVTLTEEHSWKASGSEEWLTSLNILKTPVLNVFGGLAILSGLEEYLGTSKVVSNFCNRLLSDITDASAVDEKTLPRLLLLNATLKIYEPQDLPIAQNRAMFAVKHLTTWLQEDEVLSLPTATEALRTLRCLMPSLSALYGPHWGTAIDYCVRIWNDDRTNDTPDEQLAVLDASMRLVSWLKDIHDSNEDLSEALDKSVALLSNGLMQLLVLKGRRDNQPWRIFDEFLWRQSSKIPPNLVTDNSFLYPLVASEFKFVQLATFDLLNRTIPAAQQQISIDVILEKRDAQIPEELLSLLLEAPSFDIYSDEDLTQFHSSIKTYLFSWKLVFSSYPDASFKVRNDYNETLRTGDYMTPLLNFMFDVLGHSVGQPLSLEKARVTVQDMQSYDIKLATSDSEEHHLWWLLAHLYYQCLKFAPSLSKSWWMNCKSKQTRMAVESWTEKYFSPLMIANSLEEIGDWAAQQEAPSEDEKEMVVKISKNAREVYAGFDIDETQMQIAIRLPRSYPLEGVRVEGINRVAVSEKKWQSWLMITQGVITFSNSSLIEGLLAFRKNVTGALKGQTECAICYSIISSDKKMPDKRCQTCKNLFHASCLFKWFSSSNQSSCPLCRNPFNYGAGSDLASRARRRGGPE